MSNLLHRERVFDAATQDLSLTPPEGVTRTLAGEIEKFNAAAAGTVAALRDCRHAICMDEITTAAREGADAVAALLKGLSDRKETVVDSLSKLPDLWAQRKTLAGKMLEQLEKKIGPAEKAVADKTAEVRAALNEIGSGLEAQQAYPQNLNAAARQLESIVVRNIHVRRLQAECNDAKTCRDAARDAGYASQRGAEAATQLIADAAQRLAA